MCSEWRQFEPEVILLAAGWYLRFSLSYRDVEELLAERGLFVDHVTVWRWVQRYAPEIQRRLQTRLRPTNDSWRVPAGHNLVSNPTTGAEIKRILGGENRGGSVKAIAVARPIQSSTDDQYDLSCK
jgi:hypothetical protein